MPRARANVLSGDGSGGLRARLTAPPVDGAANRALLDLVARALRVKRADLEVVRGERARDKLVAVHGLAETEVAARVRAIDVDNAERRG